MFIFYIILKRKKNIKIVVINKEVEKNNKEIYNKNKELTSQAVKLYEDIQYRQTNQY